MADPLAPAPSGSPERTGAPGGADPANSADIADSADTVELLGLVAHLQHVTFSRLAEDARLAPTIDQQLELSRFAAAAVDRRDRVLIRVGKLGGDPRAALGAYDRLLEDFESRTQPTTWWERLLRSYVTEGVSDDFCRIVAQGVDETSRALLVEVLDDAAHAELAVTALEAAGAQDTVLVSRLALWGRRLVGEALGVVQQAMAAHPGLVRLAERTTPQAAAVDGDDAGAASVTESGNGKLFGELTAAHTRRMSRLGLTA